MDVQVNYIAVILAMVSSLVVGSFWYAQGVLGRPWAKLAKVDLTKSSKNVAGPIIATMVVSLVTAYVLAHVAFLSNQFFHNSFLQDSLTIAFWLWLGLIAARFITHDAFEGRPAKLTLINVAHEFVTLMVMGAIIGFMGV